MKEFAVQGVEKRITALLDDAMEIFDIDQYDSLGYGFSAEIMPLDEIWGLDTRLDREGRK